MSESFHEGLERLDARQAEESRAAGPIDERQVWEALSMVIDPEIGLDIVKLGMVYAVECGELAVRVTFSLTTPGCPMEGVIVRGIEQAVLGVPGVDHVYADLVWEPRWNPGMIQEGAW